MSEIPLYPDEVPDRPWVDICSDLEREVADLKAQLAILQNVAQGAVNEAEARDAETAKARHACYVAEAEALSLHFDLEASRRLASEQDSTIRDLADEVRAHVANRDRMSALSEQSDARWGEAEREVERMRDLLLRSVNFVLFVSRRDTALGEQAESVVAEIFDVLRVPRTAAIAALSTARPAEATVDPLWRDTWSELQPDGHFKGCATAGCKATRCATARAIAALSTEGGR